MARPGPHPAVGADLDQQPKPIPFGLQHPLAAPGPPRAAVLNIGSGGLTARA